MYEIYTKFKMLTSDADTKVGLTSDSDFNSKIQTGRTKDHPYTSFIDFVKHHPQHLKTIKEIFNNTNALEDLVNSKGCLEYCQRKVRFAQGM